MTNTVTITSAINHPDQWQVQGNNSSVCFTEDGPFKTLDEAKAAVADHAVSCGFREFDLQVDSDAVNINLERAAWAAEWAKDELERAAWAAEDAAEEALTADRTLYNTLIAECESNAPDGVNDLIESGHLNADETIYVEKAATPGEWADLFVGSLQCLLTGGEATPAVVAWFKKNGVAG